MMKVLAAGVLSRVLVVVAAVALSPHGTTAAEAHTSGPFAGPEANQGTVTHTVRNGQSVLTLSNDFKVPDAPDPHWRIVDSHGTGYLLQRVVVKPDKINRMVVVPEHVKDVAKVQMWCAFAETLLGEASFSAPVAMRHDAASAKAIVAEGIAYDDSRMRPRDDANTHGIAYEPIEYDDSTMRPREAKGAKASEGRRVEQVEYDESRMRPAEK
jgi:hypothetical protein